MQGLLISCLGFLEGLRFFPLLLSSKSSLLTKEPLMRPTKVLLALSMIAACAAITLFAAGQNKKPAPATLAIPSNELPQPATETLDLAMYGSIREEAIAHSHIMEYASALMDGIGPRLTGSPNLKRANEWTRDQFMAMGCSNAHLEDWGEFGMGWEQLNTWVRMTSPDKAVFIAQAAPWSPSTKGVLSGTAVWAEMQEEKDFEKYKGKLAGKVLFLGEMREVKPVDKPLSTRYDDAELTKLQEYPIRLPNNQDARQQSLKRAEFREKLGQFLAAEQVAAVILPSRDGKDNGGSGGAIFDDNGSAFGRLVYQKDHANPVPLAVTAIENYGRVYRLLKANVPVTIELSIETKFFGEHEHGFDTVAEIPGTDAKLKDEIVMVGAHLDSWASATGATDNGAGSVVAMEVIRILKSVHVKPRRTVRVALWTGEEQGLLGSYGYANQHFGIIPRSTEPDQLKLSERMRRVTGPLQLKPEQQKVSGYFNVDNGSGKIRGVYLQGNAAIAPIFAQWIAPLEDLGVTTLTMRNTGGTDHLSFDAVGIPGFQFIQDPLDYETRTHHSNMDTFERLQPEDLAQAALRDQMLPRKTLPHPELQEQSSQPLKNVMPGAEPKP
jgi:carboxypeptidase Q